MIAQHVLVVWNGPLTPEQCESVEAHLEGNVCRSALVGGSGGRQVRVMLSGSTRVMFRAPDRARECLVQMVQEVLDREAA